MPPGVVTINVAPAELAPVYRSCARAAPRQHALRRGPLLTNPARREEIVEQRLNEYKPEKVGTRPGRRSEAQAAWFKKADHRFPFVFLAVHAIDIRTKRKPALVGAMVSMEHGNVIVNMTGTQQPASEVLGLIEVIRRSGPCSARDSSWRQKWRLVGE
jgi:UDP-N-acetylenolpyruvoylglucosamine reductase